MARAASRHPTAATGIDKRVRENCRPTRSQLVTR